MLDIRAVRGDPDVARAGLAIKIQINPVCRSGSDRAAIAGDMTQPNHFASKFCLS